LYVSDGMPCSVLSCERVGAAVGESDCEMFMELGSGVKERHMNLLKIDPGNARGGVRQR